MAIPQDPTSMAPLTLSECAAELALAREVVLWGLRKVGLDPANCHIEMAFSARMRVAMGRAKNESYSWQAPKGLITLNASPLWRRATPEKRRNTVLHELAHILANCEAGHNVGHRLGWKRMMTRLGEVPQRCHTLDVQGLRNKRRSDLPSLGLAPAVKNNYQVGQAVFFVYSMTSSKYGSGVILKKNPKAAKVRDSGSNKVFRVPYGLLRKDKP